MLTQKQPRTQKWVQSYSKNLANFGWTLLYILLVIILGGALPGLMGCWWNSGLPCWYSVMIRTIMFDGVNRVYYLDMVEIKSSFCRTGNFIQFIIFEFKVVTCQNLNLSLLIVRSLMFLIPLKKRVRFENHSTVRTPFQTVHFNLKTYNDSFKNKKTNILMPCTAGDFIIDIKWITDYKLMKNIALLH